MVCHSENIENCSKIFISWRWGISIVLASVLTIAGLSWAGGARFEKLEYQNRELSYKVQQLETQINKKLDILIELYKKEYKDKQ